MTVIATEGILNSNVNDSYPFLFYVGRDGIQVIDVNDNDNPWVNDDDSFFFIQK